MRDYLEHRSVENLVWHYQDALIRIKEGENATDLLPARVRRRLISLGIIRLGVGSPRSFVLTKKGREILAEETKDRIPGGPSPR
ncbi:unnamed protein product [marine sediment metagenome]|uniref:ArnR1-like winged helix-turn-helix domain-containing protein n=1 Tax=marine sediment metagenome TaxID=412755 RepID=X1KSH0_9ZZZZ